MGSFTQDLAQELDVTRRAMDLVTEYARDEKDGNINISNEDARGVMGRLGLSGEKPLRKVGEISGGKNGVLGVILPHLYQTYHDNATYFIRRKSKSCLIDVCSKA